MEEALPPEDIEEALPPEEDMEQALPPEEDIEGALPPEEDIEGALPPEERMQVELDVVHVGKAKHILEKVYYARAQKYIRTSKKRKKVCLLAQLVDEAIYLQRELTRKLEAKLAKIIALDFLEVFVDVDARKLLTGCFVYDLLTWYIMKTKEFDEPQLKGNKIQWYDFIKDDLMKILRLFARFSGKCYPDFYHGNILNGVAIQYGDGEDGDDMEPKLFNLKRESGKDCTSDIQVMWRVIAVIAGHMSSQYLKSPKELGELKWEEAEASMEKFSIPQELIGYLDRIQKFDPMLHDAALFFEDPLLWTKREGYKLMKKAHKEFFGMVDLEEKFLKAFGDIWRAGAAPAFVDGILKTIYERPRTVRYEFGHYIELWKNTIEHYNDYLKRERDEEIKKEKEKEKQKEKKRKKKGKNPVPKPEVNANVYAKVPFLKPMEIHNKFAKEFGDVVLVTWQTVKGLVTDPKVEAKEKERLLKVLEFRKGFKAKASKHTLSAATFSI